MGRIANRETGAEYCEACGNSGWVSLLGWVTIGRQQYSRGSAPCKWCDQGGMRYAAAIAPSGDRPGHKRWQPESDFTIEDVDPMGRDDEWDRRHKIPRAKLRRAEQAELVTVFNRGDIAA